MQNNLAFPPARVPIGQFTDDKGRTVGVLMTQEFARALSTLLVRVGGSSSYGIGDVLEFAAGLESSAAQVAALQATVNELKAQLAASSSMNARLAALEHQVAEVAQFAHAASPAPVDWEHPGKIGASAANSGKFTTLAATAKAQLNPKDANVELKPTGTGLVQIGPATLGAIDNMTVGATTPATGRFTFARVGAGLDFTGPATLAASMAATFSYEAPYTRFYVGDGTGYKFKFSKRTGGVTTDIVTIGDDQTLEVNGGFSCNGKPAQSAYAVGAGATDAATTQTLANNIRAALIANGICS